MTFSLRITIILLVFALSGVEAQESRLSSTIQLNSGNTQIEFSAKHLGVLNVDGTFNNFSGQLEIKNGILKSGSFIIEVASITTGSKSRDRSLKSKDFLNPESFPHINLRFEQNTNPSVVRVSTKIKGVTRTLQLRYEIDKSSKLKVSCTISRKNFNLDFGSMDDLVSDLVLVLGEVIL